ncbi:MAG: NAD(P)-binding domain-containing protein [Rhodobacteraceae bacterium]|nr:NAD(P)-binding domain-containing protein [Paracoccaceae bacterium]
MTENVARRTVMGIAASMTAIPMAAIATTATTAARAATEKPEKIAVIGTGNVGGTLGKVWSGLGHTVIYGSRTPDSEKMKALLAESPNAASALPAEAAAKSDMVLLGIPSASAVEIVKGLGNLAGKVLIDATNLLEFKDRRIVEPAECLADQIRAVATAANLVKAFNTTTVKVMADPALSGGRVTIPMAGASVQSKERIARLITAMGLDHIDLGGNDMLRMAEHLGRLYVGFGVQNRPKRLEFQLRTWSA